MELPVVTDRIDRAICMFQYSQVESLGWNAAERQNRLPDYSNLFQYSQVESLGWNRTDSFPHYR